MSGGVATLQSDGQFLSQRLAEAGLAGPRRSVEQDHSVAGHDVGVHPLVGEVEGGLDEPEQLGLDLRVVDEVLPGTLELPVGHDPVLGGRHLLLPLQADLLGLCPGGLQLVTPEPDLLKF